MLELFKQTDSCFGKSAMLVIELLIIEVTASWISKTLGTLYFLHEQIVVHSNKCKIKKLALCATDRNKINSFVSPRIYHERKCAMEGFSNAVDIQTISFKTPIMQKQHRNL